MTLLTEDLEKLRQLFDAAPYPRTPLEKSPRDDSDQLFIHSLTTAHYVRHRRLVQPEGKLILDAGCGSGYKSLMLAEANPGARIVGVDLSETSINLARQRVNYHGFSNIEFHVMPLEDLPGLEYRFDYINCDEVLYLLPDPSLGLQVMRSVLKPEGVLRANLHNIYQRRAVYRAQELFGLLGLMDTSADTGMEMVEETMQALKQGVNIKVNTWNDTFEGAPRQEMMMANHLLAGDKGFNTLQMADLLVSAELELLGMVNAQQWDWMNLFQDASTVPEFWRERVQHLSLPEQLHLYELFHPVHRLLDFWCCPSGSAMPIPADQWETADWQRSQVHLHPQLQTDKVKAALLNSLEENKSFEFSQFVDPNAARRVEINGAIAATLLPLWESAQPLQALIDRYCQLQPLNPVTLNPLTPVEALAVLKRSLLPLEARLYLFLELPVPEVACS